MCSLSHWWFKPWAAPCSAHWDGSVLLSGGRPRQQETALAARSHSRLSGASQRAAPAGQRLLYGFPQAKGTLSLEKKKPGLCAPHQPRLKGDSKYYRLEFPQIFPVTELLVSLLLFFLEDVLYCIQTHIWKRLPQAKSNFIVAFWLLSPTEEILHTQPTSLRSPDTRWVRTENLT